mgnify:CR=1 FL=1
MVFFEIPVKGLPRSKTCKFGQAFDEAGGDAQGRDADICGAAGLFGDQGDCLFD